MINTKSIVIIDDTEEVFNIATEIFSEDTEYEFTLSSSDRASINKALQEIPNLIIINGDDLNKDVLKVFQNNIENLKKLLNEIVKNLPDEQNCDCPNTIKNLRS